MAVFPLIGPSVTTGHAYWAVSIVKSHFAPLFTSVKSLFGLYSLILLDIVLPKGLERILTHKEIPVDGNHSLQEIVSQKFNKTKIVTLEEKNISFLVSRMLEYF